MKKYSMMLVEKLQKYVLSSGKTNKYKYLTGEEILPSNQKQIIGHSKITYFPLGKDNKSNKIN